MLICILLLCREKRADIAHNNEPGIFEVDENTGDMVRYPVDITQGILSYISHDWEVLDSFFKTYNIVPTWINCHYTWGWYDKEQDKWTGATGKVSGMKENVCKV